MTAFYEFFHYYLRKYFRHFVIKENVDPIPISVNYCGVRVVKTPIRDATRKTLTGTCMEIAVIIV